MTSTIVVDASALVELLLGTDAGMSVADHLESAGEVWSVAHVDAEVLSALGRLHCAGTLTVGEVDQRLALLAEMDVERLPIAGVLLQDAWALHHRVAVRDALYVAAAVRLGGKVLTTDGRLHRAIPDNTVGPA